MRCSGLKLKGRSVIVCGLLGAAMVSQPLADDKNPKPTDSHLGVREQPLPPPNRPRRFSWLLDIICS